MSLLDQISSPDFLYAAWDCVDKHNQYSRGLSGETIESFDTNKHNKIPSISRKLVSQQYKFSPTRAAVIRKDNGKLRPLQIPEVPDRLVLKALALKLEEVFSGLLSLSKNVSFAYQRGMGVRQAINQMVSIYNTGNQIILEADIINFFGEVDKNFLLQDGIFPALPDTSINELLVDALNQKVGGLDALSNDEKIIFDGVDKGIPQGNSLSPLLSNIYLSPFDQFLIQQKLGLVRYADDFIVLCHSEEQAVDTYNSIVQFFSETLILSLHPLEVGTKTRIVDPTKDSFSFLSIGFNGMECFPSEENFRKFKDRIKTVCNGHKKPDSVLILLKKVRNALEGWIASNFYTDVDRYCEELDYYINRQIYLALRGFEWKLTNNSLGVLPLKFRIASQSNNCLSQDQRKFSGIPFSQEILGKIRRTNPDT